MANRSKSIFRGPNVAHYALLHRSQRDPLINDAESSDRVLHRVDKGKGRSRADLEDALGLQDALSNIRANEGEAATHGIYFDDTVYDYMQHLKGIGESQEDGVVTTLINAPHKNDLKGKGKAKNDGELVLREEQDKLQEGTYKDFLENTTAEEGLRPDMDPALREVLEALDDDAYVEDDGSVVGDGDFIHSLIEGKIPDGESYRDGDNDLWEDEEENEVHPDSAYAQVAKFKAAKGAGDSDDEFDEDEDEERDTIAELRASSSLRPPRKKTGSSMASASAFSMSSSSMFRNDGLSTLDDRFDQIEAMYEDSEESDSEPEENELPPQLVEVVDEFLEKYEILGGKMRPILEGATPQEKLGTLRSDFSKLQVLESVKRQQLDEQRKKKLGLSDDIAMPTIQDKEKKWDVETVLSTYSNLENHPKILRVSNGLNSRSRESRERVPSTSNARIQLDPKTGFPIVVSMNGKDANTGIEAAEDPFDNSDSEEEYSDATVDAEGTNARRQTVKRAKYESPEEKRARKQEVKSQRQARRTEKKTMKETFGNERKRQQKVKAGKLRDAADIGRDNVRGIEVMKLS